MSPLLSSFDPFATHPFTNNSGLIPKPPQPSRYPIPIPSPPQSSYLASQYFPNGSVSPSSPPSTMGYSPVKSPQPLRANPAPPNPRHIFEPFRQENSSPELVLKKKSSPSNGSKTKA